MEWKLSELSVDGKGHYGIGAPAIPYDKNKPTYLRITDINDDGTINFLDLKSVDDEDSNKYLLKENDIVFARTGNSTGRSYFYQKEHGDFVYAGFLIKFSIDPQKVNPKILKYYTHSQEYYNWVKSFDTGGTRGNINAKTFGDMPISLPKRCVQDKIVGILSALDSKIENNNKINANLEAQAEALFKSWFVDFTPFKDQPFVDSELGPIPQGWKVGKLGDYVEIKRGGSPRPIQKFLASQGLNWLKISDATSTQSPFIFNIKEKIIIDGLKKTVFLKAGSLVLSNSATPCIPKFLSIDSCIHDGWLYFPHSQLPENYLYLFFKLMRNNLVSKANGSVFLNLKTDIVKNQVFAFSGEEIYNSFDKIIAPLFKEIENLTYETFQLSALRDTLLPKLMSGEIKL